MYIHHAHYTIIKCKHSKVFPLNIKQPFWYHLLHGFLLITSQMGQAGMMHWSCWCWLGGTHLEQVKPMRSSLSISRRLHVWSLLLSLPGTPAKCNLNCDRLTNSNVQLQLGGEADINRNQWGRKQDDSRITIGSGRRFNTPCIQFSCLYWPYSCYWFLPVIAYTYLTIVSSALPRMLPALFSDHGDPSIFTAIYFKTTLIIRSSIPVPKCNLVNYWTFILNHWQYKYTFSWPQYGWS